MTNDGGEPSAPPAHTWYRKRWVIVAALLLFGLFLLHHCTGSPPQPAGGRAQQGNTAITAGQSRGGDMGIYVNALGSLRAGQKHHEWLIGSNHRVFVLACGGPEDRHGSHVTDRRHGMKHFTVRLG